MMAFSFSRRRFWKNKDVCERTAQRRSTRRSRFLQRTARKRKEGRFVFPLWMAVSTECGNASCIDNGRKFPNMRRTAWSRQKASAQGQTNTAKGQRFLSDEDSVKKENHLSGFRPQTAFPIRQRILLRHLEDSDMRRCLVEVLRLCERQRKFSYYDEVPFLPAMYGDSCIRLCRRLSPSSLRPAEESFFRMRFSMHR